MSFDSSTATEDGLGSALRSQVRQDYFRKKVNSLPTEAEIRSFQSLVHTNASTFGSELQEVLTYWNFMHVREQSPKSVQALLSTELFAADQITEGIAMCDVSVLFDVVDTRLTFTKYSLILSFYDEDGDNYITSSEFYNFYLDHVAVNFPQLQNFMAAVCEEETNVVLTTITSKLVTFLDRTRCGRVSIKDILYSGIITEIDSILNGCTRYDYCNWFSPENIIFITEEFQQLNVDGTGILKYDQFVQYQPNIKNKKFLSKIFEVLNKDGIMDLGFWCKFQLIIRHKSNPVSLKYIFHALDFDSDGVITRKDLQEHFEELCFISLMYEQSADTPPDFDNFVVEIFDMLQLDRSKSFITLEDWLKGLYVHAVALKLINSPSFSMHEWEEDRARFLERDVDTQGIVEAPGVVEELAPGGEL